MEQLQAMGFEAYKCERALAECGQNVEAAVEFVFANSHQPEEWWRQEAEAPAVSPQSQQPDSMSQLVAAAAGVAGADDDAELERAIAMSMDATTAGAISGATAASEGGMPGEATTASANEDSEVAQAIAMSLEGATGTEGACAAATTAAAESGDPDRPSDDQIREYQAQVMGAQAESIKNKPLVGEPESLDVLKQEYEDGLSVFVQKLDVLSQRYRWIRRARNDGNCFYRGFAFVRILSQPAASLLPARLSEFWQWLNSLSRMPSLPDLWCAVASLRRHCLNIC